LTPPENCGSKSTCRCRVLTEVIVPPDVLGPDTAPADDVDATWITELSLIYPKFSRVLRRFYLKLTSPRSSARSSLNVERQPTALTRVTGAKNFKTRGTHLFRDSRRQGRRGIIRSRHPCCSTFGDRSIHRDHIRRGRPLSSARSRRSYLSPPWPDPAFGRV
jgi:hypothetical protein